MQYINGSIAVAVLLYAFTAYALNPGDDAARALKNPPVDAGFNHCG